MKKLVLIAATILGLSSAVSGDIVAVPYGGRSVTPYMVSQEALKSDTKALSFEALALPDDPLREFQMLRQFINRVRPIPEGYDIIMINDNERPIGREYSKTPVIYKGLRVWLKRDA